MVSKKQEKSQSKEENVGDKIQLIEKNISILRISLLCSYIFTIVVAFLLIFLMKSEVESTVQRVLNENKANPLKR